MTDAEHLLWAHLRRGYFHGAKFRRQVPIGPYIADFVCESQRLIIELDGGQHAGHEQYDEARSAVLRACGYRVERFWNTDVLQNLEGVWARLEELLEIS